jgi:polysaccharide biosynthesis transport protein
MAESSPESSLIVPSQPGLHLARQLSYVAGTPYNSEEANGAESGSGLIEYWRLLLRHKGNIVLSAVAGLVLGFVIGIPMTPVYRARTSIEVLNLNEDFMNMKQSNPVTTADYSDEVSEEETQAQLLQGDALLRRVTSKLNPEPAHVQQKSQIAASGWRHWLYLRVPIIPTPLQKSIGTATKSLKVRVSPRTRVLEITADSTNPEFAATFVNTLIHEFVLQSVEARLSNTQHTGDWLKQEIDDARANLQRSENALQAYARDSGLIFTDPEAETNVATEKLQQLQLSLSAATTDRISKESRFELAKNSPPDSIADVLNDEGLQTLNDRINGTVLKVADLSAVYTSDYSGVKRAKAELAALQTSFETKRADIIQKISTDYEQAQRDEKLLEAAYVAQAREVAGQDEKTVQYNILKREVDSNRQLYDTMLQQMKQAYVASALHASNLRVVDPAVPPETPVYPNFKLNSAIGLFVGLILSVAFFSARERSDRTLQMPGDVKLWTDLPELGTIPVAAVARKRIASRASSRGHRKDIAGEKGLSRVTDGADPVELITFRHKPSLIAEAFRSALTSILFVGENRSRPCVLLFTSTQPGDGKTTVVSNIGIALAEIRKKTLIIDADLRRPRMHDVFGVPNERGLSNLLQEEFSETNLAILTHDTRIPGLSLLTGGPSASAASHLLYSPNLEDVLVKSKQTYDMILIDTPPMIPITDARVIGRLADAAILIARAGKTTRHALLLAKERFEEDHTHVLGSILNCWDPKRDVGSYYNGEYKQYHSSYLFEE